MWNQKSTYGEQATITNICLCSEVGMHPPAPHQPAFSLTAYCSWMAAMRIFRQGLCFYNDWLGWSCLFSEAHWSCSSVWTTNECTGSTAAVAAKLQPLHPLKLHQLHAFAFSLLTFQTHFSSLMLFKVCEDWVGSCHAARLALATLNSRASRLLLPPFG